MKNTLILVLLTLAFSTFAYGQHEKVTDNWETISIADSTLGLVNYHVYKNALSTQKPLIVYLQGSKNFPLYWPRSDGHYSTSTTLDFRSLSQDYHVIIISKPNIPFVDSLGIAPSGRKYYPTNEEYRERYSLDWRTNAADRVIDDALQRLSVDRSRIIVWGYSEGSQVAPAVAVKNQSVTHVISMMGNSLNHLYDFILQERVAALNGDLSNEEAQSNIDSLYAEFEKIYRDPTSTTKEWFGETYYKWSSFTLNAPLENMLKLDIPILYVAGGADRQSILNMDYAKLEFLRRGKDNLTYKVFPNCDHFCLETRVDASGKKEWIDRLGEVNGFALEWLEENGK
ncbi:MAG: hypothetical protein AAFR05_07265 [Bacteroidota bacterium]